MSIKRLAALVVALGLLGALPSTALAAEGSYWNVAGTYGVNVIWDQDPSPGTIYAETLDPDAVRNRHDHRGVARCAVLARSPTSPSRAARWSVTPSSSGRGVFGTLTSRFTATIGRDRLDVGTWADIDGGSRTGTWATTSGAATFLTANTHAEVGPRPVSESVRRSGRSSSTAPRATRTTSS